MNTAEKKANGVQGAAAKNNAGKSVPEKIVSKTAARPNVPLEEAKVKSSEETVKEVQSSGVPEQQANTRNDAADMAASKKQDEDAAKENFKNGITFLLPTPNLEQTLKSVESLHRLSIQRLALITRIKLLEQFEVKLIEEGDELEANPYQGCKLIIEDDKRRQFTTNTPNLIRMVSQYIFNACNEKLTEIEANIVFPNA